MSTCSEIVETKSLNLKRIQRIECHRTGTEIVESETLTSSRDPNGVTGGFGSLRVSRLATVNTGLKSLASSRFMSDLPPSTGCAAAVGAGAAADPRACGGATAGDIQRFQYIVQRFECQSAYFAAYSTICVQVDRGIALPPAGGLAMGPCAGALTPERK